MSDPYVPPAKHFPDGTWITYYLQGGVVKGQLCMPWGLFDAREVGGPFTYHGPCPAPWDKDWDAYSKKVLDGGGRLPDDCLAPTETINAISST